MVTAVIQVKKTVARLAMLVGMEKQHESLDTC